MYKIPTEYIQTIRDSNTTKLINPTPEQLSSYKDNFYGLLAELGVDYKLFQICLVINGLSDPTDTESLLDDIYVPSASFVYGLLKN